MSDSDLEALLKQAPIKKVPLSRVFFPKKTPWGHTQRLKGSDGNFQELKDSIETQGQRTPVILREHRTDKNKYFVVSGFRRVHAMRFLKNKHITGQIIPYLAYKNWIKIAINENVTLNVKRLN